MIRLTLIFGSEFYTVDTSFDTFFDFSKQTLPEICETKISKIVDIFVMFELKSFKFNIEYIIFFQYLLYI